jgi:multidrug efflux system membrane fusion protein
MGRFIGAPFLLIAGLAAAGCGQASSQTGPPKDTSPLVKYDLPVTKMVTDYEDFPGRTDAIYSVTVTARVSGYLDRVYFQDGMQVTKGDVLFQIDPRPFKATLDRTKGALAQAEAHAKRLNNEYRRAQVLYERGLSISREEYDRYVFDHAEADAALGTAHANVDLAALDLEFTRVTAPISGRLSRRMVDPGNLVKADETSLTTIVTQDPLYVYFDVHEQAMLKIRRLIQEGKVKAKSEKEVPVQLSLSDEKDSEGKDIFTHEGIVDFTDNRVDLNTGTLRFRAKLDNPNQMITPGLFVKVRLPIGDPHPALMVREQALQSDQSQKKVLVLQARDENGNPYFIEDDKGNVVKDKAGNPVLGYKPIAVDIGTPGVLRDGFREITRGIKPEDWVIAAGMQKVRLGNKPLSEEEKAKGVKPKPNLVRAEPFDPDKDSTSRPSVKPASEVVSVTPAPSAAAHLPEAAPPRRAETGGRHAGSPGKTENATGSGRLGR